MSLLLLFFHDKSSSSSLYLLVYFVDDSMIEPNPRWVAKCGKIHNISPINNNVSWNDPVDGDPAAAAAAATANIQGMYSEVAIA